MKTTSFTPFVLLCLFFNVAPISMAQAEWLPLPFDPKERLGGDPYAAPFDTNSMVRVRGIVRRLVTFTPRSGDKPEVKALLQSGTNLYTIHLGPKWYLKTQEVKVKTKDELVVTGSRLPGVEPPVILATMVNCHKKTLRLRDPQGLPMWTKETPSSIRSEPFVTTLWLLQLPEGDLERGKKAYRDLWCHACHVAKGYEKEFPAPYADPKVPVVLGAESYRPTRIELVNSIIQPSHRLEPEYQRELISNGTFSRMGDYNEIMTIQQLSDLVVFLRTLHGP